LILCGFFFGPSPGPTVGPTLRQRLPPPAGHPVEVADVGQQVDGQAGGLPRLGSTRGRSIRR
jgi:hypothetical protein